MQFVFAGKAHPQDSIGKGILQEIDKLSRNPRFAGKIVFVEDYDMSQNLARVLKQMGQDAPMPTPILEINLDHPLLQRMDQESDEDKFGELSKLVFDQALLAARQSARLREAGEVFNDLFRPAIGHCLPSGVEPSTSCTM